MMWATVAVVCLCRGALGAWGPREALVAHEKVHEASHEAEAAGATHGAGGAGHGEAGLAHLQAVVEGGDRAQQGRQRGWSAWNDCACSARCPLGSATTSTTC